MGKRKLKRGQYWRRDWKGYRPTPTPSIRGMIRQAYRNRCVLCGEPAWKVDHIFPFFFGGKNQHGNLVLLCDRHNREKGAFLDSPIMRFLAHLGYESAQEALRVAEWVRKDVEWIEQNLPKKVAEKVLEIKNKYPWAVGSGSALRRQACTGRRPRTERQGDHTSWDGFLESLLGIPYFVHF